MGRKGFTLLELILVISIIAIVTALTTPLIFEGLYGDTKVTAASDMVRAHWANGRSQAIEEGRPYHFAVVPNTGRFKIEPHQADVGGSSFINPDAAPNSDSSAGLIIEGSLPQGVRFGTADSPANADIDEPAGGEYVVIAVFEADGSAQDNVEITFGSKGSNSITLRLQKVTGAITTVRSQEHGQ